MSIFALASCTSSEEPLYSCDPTINNWVKSNLKQIQSMKRTEWLNLAESKKKPAYIAFTSDEKYAFWEDKFNEVLKLDWSVSEKNHILQLHAWMSKNPKIFEELDQESELYLECEKFQYTWIKEGESNFGWDKKLIYSIAFTGNKLLDKKGNVQINLRKIKRFKVVADEEPAVKVNCDCSGRYDCLMELDCDTKKTCTTKMGCGILMTTKCNGLCS